MRYWKSIYPDNKGRIIIKIVSEDEILQNYWNFWKEKMLKAKKDRKLITKKNCIEDWVTENWALEVTKQ